MFIEYCENNHYEVLIYNKDINNNNEKNVLYKNNLFDIKYNEPKDIKVFDNKIKRRSTSKYKKNFFNNNDFEEFKYNSNLNIYIK